MKKPYEALECEIILFEMDIVTLSDDAENDIFEN